MSACDWSVRSAGLACDWSARHGQRTALAKHSQHAWIAGNWECRAGIPSTQRWPGIQAENSLRSFSACIFNDMTVERLLLIDLDQQI